MISEERLNQLADTKMICVCKDEEYQQMARELLSLRKAFSEPAAWVPLSQLNLLWKKKNVIVEADMSVAQRFNEVPLYCKPDLPE